MISGIDNLDTVERAQKAGAVDYVSKPFWARDVVGMMWRSSCFLANLVRVIVIKRPNIHGYGIELDHFRVGETYEVSPALALLMMAAGWLRPHTRRAARRMHGASAFPFPERRWAADRRAAGACC